MRDWLWYLVVIGGFIGLAAMGAMALTGIVPTGDELLQLLFGPHARYL